MSAATRSSGGAGRLHGRPARARRAAVALPLVLALAALAAVPPASTRADDPPPAGLVSAENVTIVIQVLWQVQQGCQQYCYGTQQTQSASQDATTIQVATASTTGTAAGAAASADNTTIVIQLVIQSQLGCVAFCYDTSSQQLAVQHSDVAQVADAVSSVAAAATNTALVTQLAWQFQTACAEECHDATATQDAAQTSAILQSALGAAGGAPSLDAFTSWLATVAGGAVIDVVQQIDQAACQDHCVGDLQVQVGVQADGLARTADAAGAAVPAGGIVVVLAPGGRVRHVASMPAASVASTAGSLAAGTPAAGIFPAPSARGTTTSHHRSARPRVLRRKQQRPACGRHRARTNNHHLKFSIGGNRCGS
ncbi:MAG TPA: hypothetical protein VFT50_04820 [Baekduia sp.]|nr:hypothetical protein [Baekduia sp.]